jgi:Delta-aminolevulinic acid dehydratase
MGYMANFPETRLRRLRTNQKMRDLFQEVSISPKDLICPVFVEEGIEAKKQLTHCQQWKDFHYQR